MKIQFLYAKGNAEILNRQSALGSYMHCLCDLLIKNGHSVYFNTIPFEKIIQKTSSDIVTNPTGKGKWNFVPNSIKNLIKDIRKLSSIKKLKKELCTLNFQPDIIIEFYNYGSNLGKYFSEKLNCPLILIYDAPVLEEYEFFNGKNYFLRNIIINREKKALKKASSILIYSDAVKKHVQSKVKKKEKNYFIHQNVDFTRFDFIEPRPLTPPIKIGFIGSFLKWHRVDLLLDAFEGLYNKKLTVELILIGSGVEINEIKNKISKLNSRGNITLTGFKDGKDLLALKEQIQIGVMPGSNWYGAPNKIFEYGAAGMAVVAPNTPTIMNLFKDNTELLLFKWDDVNDLQKKLETIISNEMMYSKLSKTLNQKIKTDYSQEKTLNFYVGMINETLKNKN